LREVRRLVPDDGHRKGAEVQAARDRNRGARAPAGGRGRDRVGLVEHLCDQRGCLGGAVIPRLRAPPSALLLIALPRLLLLAPALALLLPAVAGVHQRAVVAEYLEP